MAVVIYIYIYGSMFFGKFSGFAGASLSTNFRSMLLVNFLILKGRHHRQIFDHGFFVELSGFE